jgi:hypothetical protein
VVTTVHAADTALLVARALRRGSTVLAALVGGLTCPHGPVALLVGLAAVLVLHVVVGIRVRSGLDDRLEREWAAVEPRWSRPGAM